MQHFATRPNLHTVDLSVIGENAQLAFSANERCQIKIPKPIIRFIQFDGMPGLDPLAGDIETGLLILRPPNVTDRSGGANAAFLH